MSDVHEEHNMERPIPITKDRQGKLAKDYTLKDWFAKLNEELDELKEACLSEYYFSENIARDLSAHGTRKAITEEACDMIKVVYSMCNQMGIDGDSMEKAMHECNEKTRRRGCHE